MVMAKSYEYKKEDNCMWIKYRFIGNSGEIRNCGTWWGFKKLRVLGDNKVEAWVNEQVVWMEKSESFWSFNDKEQIHN